MDKIKIIILIMGIGMLSLVLVNFINAQGRGLGISPLTFELTANPGDVIINQLRVYNPSDSIIGIKMEVEDFTVTGEIGHVKIEPAETETYSLTRWVKTEPSEFTLEPGEWKFVNFTINVPENAEPGGHYGSILASTVGVTGPGITGSAIAQRVGALVLLSVSGDIKEELSVKSFSIPKYSEYGPIVFTIRLENTGTVHVKPRGFITITNWMGRKVTDLEFPIRNVIPGAVRKIETSWDKKWFWAGKYTATLSGSYGIGNTPFGPTVVTFWAFPWKVGAGILLIIMFFILTRRRWAFAFKVLVKGEKAIK